MSDNAKLAELEARIDAMPFPQQIATSATLSMAIAIDKKLDREALLKIFCAGNQMFTDAIQLHLFDKLSETKAVKASEAVLHLTRRNAARAAEAFAESAEAYLKLCRSLGLDMLEDAFDSLDTKWKQ